jgi:NTP pyrophosphatase (non-canonical NTP hydrolase)
MCEMTKHDETVHSGGVDVHWLPHCSAFPRNHAAPLVCRNGLAPAPSPNSRRTEAPVGSTTSRLSSWVMNIVPSPLNAIDVIKKQSGGDSTKIINLVKSIDSERASHSNRYEDVLLQVLLHATIAEQNHTFNLESVAKTLADKLIKAPSRFRKD